MKFLLQNNICIDPLSLIYCRYEFYEFSFLVGTNVLTQASIFASRDRFFVGSFFIILNCLNFYLLFSLLYSFTGRVVKAKSDYGFLGSTSGMGEVFFTLAFMLMNFVFLFCYLVEYNIIILFCI